MKNSLYVIFLSPTLFCIGQGIQDPVTVSCSLLYICVCAKFMCDVRFITGSSNMLETAHAQWKIAKMCQKQRRSAKIPSSYRNSMSLNPFPVTDLRQEVKSRELLRMRRHCLKHIALDWLPSSLERCLVIGTFSVEKNNRIQCISFM